MKVLIVDDEPQIRRLLGVALKRAGHDVAEAGDAASALRLARTERPAAILLDLGLPDRDGIELIPLLKTDGDPALIILSARDATDEKVAALDLGADDYVTKPFDSEELLARLRTAARHAGRRGEERLSAGEIMIDLAARRVERSGEEVHLTRKEFALLAELAAHPGRVLTHGQLLRTIWGPAHEKDIEYLRVVVRNLRQKLEEDAARPSLIVNDPGVGYRLAR
ncbi:two component transcriptional regulator, winged helix family [Rhizorhabdus wittichii RW1]|jgi:two-component system KDP operon response regulator KdpE|uniref:Two component transcriptional regulator, winged helix family n=1 Tax=Rhizorhabdus wittichii (strain DSM 6014 / CCUG 31198 / JCM 15750 / NBRC 105917 / EY 4224 / RW1) TaxID=392499 RepID=A0A9J9HA49_RHIWR|nr:two component transcriptional regulator, winged helix family [Rhizorhabdus wittichii RW1]